MSEYDVIAAYAVVRGHAASISSRQKLQLSPALRAIRLPQPARRGERNPPESADESRHRRLLLVLLAVIRPESPSRVAALALQRNAAYLYTRAKC